MEIQHLYFTGPTALVTYLDWIYLPSMYADLFGYVDRTGRDLAFVFAQFSVEDPQNWN